MLVTTDYFVGELSIPYVNSVALTQRLNSFIDQYEPKFLRSIMGYKLYKSYEADATTVRWVDMITGKEYEVNGVLYKWDGLAFAGDFNADFDLFQTTRSMIAKYIYYWWMRDQATQSSAVGETATKTENSVRVSPAQKMVDAWNSMVENVHWMWHFLDSNTATYPEWSLNVKAWSEYRTINTFGI